MTMRKETVCLKPYPIVVIFVIFTSGIGDGLWWGECLLWHTLSIGWELDAACEVCQVLKPVNGFTMTHETVVPFSHISSLEKGSDW